MDPELVREWRRWAASERDGLGEEADAAFRGLFRLVPVRAPNASFADELAQVTARAAARQARLVRAALVAGGVCALALAIALVLQIPRLLGAAVDLLVGSVVSMTLALGRGLDLWTLLAQITRAIGVVIVTPQATYVLIVLGVIAIGALYGLQRMLELEERSSS